MTTVSSPSFIRYISLTLRLISSFLYFIIYSESDISAFVGISMIYSLCGTAIENYTKFRSVTGKFEFQQYTPKKEKGLGIIYGCLTSILLLLCFLLFFPRTSLVRVVFNDFQFLLLSTIPYLQALFVKMIYNLRDNGDSNRDVAQYLVPAFSTLIVQVALSLCGIIPSYIFICSMLLPLIATISYIQILQTSRINNRGSLIGNKTERFSSHMFKSSKNFDVDDSLSPMIGITSCLIYSLPSLAVSLATRLTPTPELERFISSLFLAIKLGDMFVPVFASLEHDFPYAFKEASQSTSFISLLRSKQLTDLMVSGLGASFALLVGYLLFVYSLLCATALVFPSSTAASFINLEAFSISTGFLTVCYFTCYFAGFDMIAGLIKPSFLLTFDYPALVVLLILLLVSVLSSSYILVYGLVIISSCTILFRRLVSFYLFRITQKRCYEIAKSARLPIIKFY